MLVAHFVFWCLTFGPPCLPATSAPSKCRVVQDPPSALLDEMLRTDSSIRAGRCDSEGAYVLALIPLDSSTVASIARARQQAVSQIGNYLGAMVSSDTLYEYEEKSSNDTATSRSLFRNQSRIYVSRTLAGIEVLKSINRGDKTSVAFILSERVANGISAVEEGSDPTQRASGTYRVEALGACPATRTDQEGKAEALRIAQQQALEMVLGVSLVGMTFSLDQENDSDLRSQFYSGVFTSTNSDGFIQSFEVLEQGSTGDGGHYVRIRALVAKGKILANFRTHLDAIGAPTFGVDASGDQALEEMARVLLQEKGFRIVDIAAAPDWVVIIQPTYTVRQDPRRSGAGATGVQCRLSIHLRNQATGELQAALNTAGDSSDFLSGGEGSQRFRAATKAFRSSVPKFQQKLQDTILRMAREGRQMFTRIHGLDPDSKGIEPRALDSFQGKLAQVPGIHAPKAMIKEGVLVVELRSPLPRTVLCNLIAGELAQSFPGARASTHTLTDSVADLIVGIR